MAFLWIRGHEKMEKVYHRALRFVLNDFHASYSDLSSKAGRSLLYIRRLKAIVREVFRMYSNVSPAYNRGILITLLHYTMLHYQTFGDTYFSGNICMENNTFSV